MKEEFYCLPLKKKVTAKIKRIVRKGNRYSLKSSHKVGDKEYNLTKTCGKARAEEVSSATGIEIEEIKAAEGFPMEPVTSSVRTPLPPRLPSRQPRKRPPPTPLRSIPNPRIPRTRSVP